MTFKEFLNEGPIPKANQGGDCYEVSYQYFQKNALRNDKLRLVHGLVTGQGPLEGIVYNHAWVEDGNKIIDMTLPTKLQKSLSKSMYYKIGKIKESNVYKYNYNEVIEKSLEYKTYGPWEKKLLRNKY